MVPPCLEWNALPIISTNCNSRFGFFGRIPTLIITTVWVIDHSLLCEPTGPYRSINISFADLGSITESDYERRYCV